MWTSQSKRMSPHIWPPLASMSKQVLFSERLGLTGLYLFAFFSLLNISGANIGLGLMLIGILFCREAWRQLFRQSLFWISLAIVGYIILRLFGTSAQIGAEREIQFSQTRHWIQLFLFFIPAWWISRAPQRIPTTLALMIGGFALGILSTLDGAILSQIAQGVRTGMHFGKPIIFGFDCAAAILGLVVMLMYWLNPQLEQSRLQQVLSISLTLLGILFFTQGLVISQSRGVWLAVLFAVPTIFLTLKFTRQRRRQPRVSVLIPLFGLAMLLILVLALNWTTITERITTENRELSIVVTEGLNKAPLSPLTYRLHLWEFGLNKWLERPFTGWGPGTTHALIEAENRPALKDNMGISFDHLHNAYLEVAFQLGVVGIFLVALLCGLMVSKLMEAFLRKRISVYFLAFLFSNFVLIAVYSLTDFRHLHWNWRFYWLIIAGIAYAFTLLTDKASSPQTKPQQE